MKEYLICVGSHESNNSDYIEYNNYYTKANSWEEAYEYAKKCIANWNKKSKNGIVYSIDHVTPHN